MSTATSGVQSANAGDFLQPDDITFSTLVRGYGESEPPQWSGISTVLATMQQRFGMRPDTGGTGCGPGHEYCFACDIQRCTAHRQCLHWCRAGELCRWLCARL
jgi:hypothetical protein